jgi:hypothetical protein
MPSPTPAPVPFPAGAKVGYIDLQRVVAESLVGKGRPGSHERR